MMSLGMPFALRVFPFMSELAEICVVDFLVQEAFYLDARGPWFLGVKSFEVMHGYWWATHVNVGEGRRV